MAFATRCLTCNGRERNSWAAELKALYRRHAALVVEMGRRGYRHQTPLPAEQAIGLAQQQEYKDTPAAQVEILRRKGCGCRV